MLQSAPRAARSPLLQLPPELLQCIYLHCLEPSMALASGYLGAVLSSEPLLRATVFQAFWNPTPLKFIYNETQPVVNLPRLHRLAQSANLREQRPDERERLQELVLAQCWCTASRLRTCFATLLSIVWRDLLQDLNLSFAPEHRLALDSLIDNPPRQSTIFEATSLDGVSIQLEHPLPLARSARLTYSGPDPRFDSRTIPNLQIQPTKVAGLPNSCLRGDIWTESNVQKLQILCNEIDLVEVKYSDDAFHAGMKNAVLQQNSTALLVLACAADRISQRRGGYPYLGYFELPQDIFRLVVLDLREGDDDESADAIAISMFKILIRTHAESMPQHDKDIIAWATKLVSRSRDRAFGQWLIDFSTRPTDVHTPHIYHGRSPRFQYFFQDGRISYARSGDAIMKSFCKIEGCEPQSFSHEVANINFSML